MDELVIRNCCATDRIDPRFLPVIDAARAGMLACCGGRVRELRLQGSIARGDARAGHADLDMIALLDGPPTPEEIRCVEALAASLGEAAALVSRCDLEVVDANLLEPFRRFVLSSDSLCLHGADSLTLPVQTVERLTLARLVTPDPAVMLPDYLAWVQELEDAGERDRLFASRIIGKDLLKVLRGVLLLRGAQYEVAIPRIAAQVALVLPGAVGVAEGLFALYAEPVADVGAIRRASTEAVSLVRACSELSRLHGAVDTNHASAEEVAP